MPTVSQRPRIAPVAEPSAKARRLCADARTHGTPNPDVYLVLDHCPELMTTFHEHWRAMFDHGVVDRGLKELVRRRIAETIDCATCRVVGVDADPGSIDEKLQAACDWRSTSALTATEKAAMWLVDVMLGVDDGTDAMYAELHRHLSEAEIVELGWFAAFNVGTIRFVRSWRLHEQH
jgi:alkylhydroperoxidase family enzyme